MRRRSVVWLAATGAVLIAVLLGVRSWLLRDKTEPVDVDRVVERYRGDRTAATTTPAGGLPAGVRVPHAGVYEYATTGGEEADLIGTSRHDYPATTAITIVPGGCGFSAQWQALDLRSERWSYCAEDGGLRTTRFDDVHSFFGRTDERTYRCDGGILPLTAKAEPQRIVCRREGTTRTDRVRDLGAETLDVGGEKVSTVHLRTAVTMRGATDGGGTIDTWLQRDTGLPVRISADLRSKSDTPIGTRVDYTERYDLRLRSLQPRQ